MKMTGVPPELVSLLIGGAIAFHAKAGTFSSDFNSGTNAPAGTALYGNNGGGVIETTGGVNNSGVLKLTKAINNQSGSFIIEDLDGGNPVYGFDMTFKLRLGGGTVNTPADGFSVNFAPDVPDGTFGEDGVGSGIRIGFDIYNNGATENPPAPSIDVRIGATAVATRKMTVPQITTDTNFEDVHIQLNPNGSLNMTYKGAVLFTNFFLPGYQGISGGRFGFGGRTGGANENQWIDNLQITTSLQPQVGISQQPFSQKVLPGHDALFTVQISSPDGAAPAFKWLKNGTTVIPGATAQTLTVTNVTAADSNTKYKVQITAPNNTVTSDEVTLTVGDIPLPATPKLFLDFDSGTAPQGTSVTGTTIVDSTGGVTNSGVLKLTVADINQTGAFIIEDIDAGAPVYGFTARFQVLVGGGTAPPADGFSFNFATNIPAAPAGGLEDGTGTGLTVGFDIYNNDTIFGISPPAEATPAPSIDVRYNNQLIASTHLPLSFIETGDSYDEVIIRLKTDGTLDVAYRGVVVHDNVLIPGFTSIAGGRFALAGRTGGLSENQWVDNLQITTETTPGSVRITTQPANQTVLVGKPATFSVVVNDPAATFQWFRGTTAIAGATSSSYTTPATTLADSGAKFKVQATKGLTITSDEVTLTVVDLAPPADPTVSFNFDNGQLPAGTQVFGGGTNSSGNPWVPSVVSGVLELTTAVNGQAGAFVIQPLLAGAELSGFTAAFDVRVGGGTAPPADGFSFNFAPDLPNGTIGGAEDGGGTGLTIGFDIFDNLNETPPAPSIDVRYKNTVVASTRLPYQQIETGNDFRQVLVRVSAEGKLDLAYGDRVLYTGLQLPNYAFISNGKFGFYARTGGLNENQWLDNLSILAIKSVLPLRITQEPADAAVLTGRTASFTVVVSDPNGATYRWSKNNAAIPGATNATYTTPATTFADDGATFGVQVVGPGGTVNSRQALLSVVPPITISNPKISFDFNDGAVPPGTTLIGVAGGGYVDSSGGVNNSGVLKLTDNNPNGGQTGTFLIDDVDSGQAVSAFTAHFSMLVGGGTSTPADGFSFVWANDLSSTAGFGEDGSGSGLIVSFDIFDNGGGEAPAIDVRYKTLNLASKKVPISFLETGSAFVDVFVRVESDGTLDVQYNGNVAYNNLPLTGYAPLAGGRFGFGARTGGLVENQWVDNIQIATTVSGPPIIIARGTSNITLTWGTGFKLQSTPSLSPPQWADVQNAVSPFPASTTTGTQYYRLINTP